MALNAGHLDFLGRRRVAAIVSLLGGAVLTASSGGVASAAAGAGPIGNAEAPRQSAPAPAPESGDRAKSGNLSEQLDKSRGVISPPQDVDPQMQVRPPESSTGKMPVIPPPGSPGGNPNVVPK